MAGERWILLKLTWNLEHISSKGWILVCCLALVLKMMESMFFFIKRLEKRGYRRYINKSQASSKNPIFTCSKTVGVVIHKLKTTIRQAFKNMVVSHQNFRKNPLRFVVVMIQILFFISRLIDSYGWLDQWKRRLSRDIVRFCWSHSMLLKIPFTRKETHLLHVEKWTKTLWKMISIFEFTFLQPPSG